MGQGQVYNQTLVLPALAQYQRDAIFAPERFVAIEASTKSGKTFACICWLLAQAWEGVGICRWIAPVYPQAEIAYKRMTEMLRKMDPQQRLWSATKIPMAIKLVNGSTIEFRSGDEPDNLYGDDVIAMVEDEASRCTEAVWVASRSTLTATKGKARIIGNVRGRNTWHYQTCRKVEAGQLPGWKYAAFNWRMAVEAGLVDAEEVDAARRELTEEQFRELYENVASDDGGNPFGLQHIAGCVAGLSDAEPVYFGVDIARATDWTVIIGLDADRRVCRYHRWQHVPWDETKKRIVELTGDTPTLIDSTGVGDAVVDGIQRMRGGVEGYQFTSTSKQHLMQALAVAIQSRAIGFPDGPIRLELDAFEFDVRPSGVRYSAPVGFHDDCVCALALANWKAISSGPVSVSVVQAVGPVVRDDWKPSGGERTGYGFAGSRGRGYSGW